MVGLGCGGGGSAGSAVSHNKLQLDLFSGNQFCYSEFTFAFLDCYIEGMIRWRDLDILQVHVIQDGFREILIDIRWVHGNNS